MLLGSMAFSSLGMWLGTAIAPQQIGLMFSVIIAPMLFFGCAYYPWRGLDVVPVMKYLVLVNPMVYVAEGMRGALTPSVPHMPLAVVGVALRRDRRRLLDARHAQLLQAGDRMTTACRADEPIARFRTLLARGDALPRERASRADRVRARHCRRDGPAERSHRSAQGRRRARLRVLHELRESKRPRAARDAARGDVLPLAAARGAGARRGQRRSR